MKKFMVLLLSGIICVTFSATAPAQDRYERYERYPAGGPPPPPRGAPAPPPRHAVYGQTYFFGHVGFFEPNDDDPTPTGGGLGGYDTGGSFDIGIGSRVSPILAIEGAVGGFSAERGPDEVTVVPLTFGIRLILPNPVIEPYIGAGLGMYFADLQEVPRPGFIGIDDSDTTVGGYVSGGLDAWLNPRLALNFEGKYHFAEPEFNGIDVDVSGWTFGMGIRISF
ncbi:MAG TPA: outer membrane beta-barrel protein [Candidatus Deferrimicrobiaceae bacterium]|nr:outer membrane beta-barrel protein [Candidatus Deferrimicrobiaceae bacterium]